MIEFSNVTYTYPYDEFSVLDGTTFSLNKGVNTLLCDIQSGKTTVCKLIMGLLAPQSGAVSVLGTNPSECRPDVLYLPQEPVLFPHRSVLYNLSYPLTLRKIKPKTSDIAEIAQQFGLAEKLQSKAKTLSPKEKMYLALARGLTVKRQIVLFDGIFDGDDISPAEIIQKYFSQCETVVVVTSNFQNAAGHTVVLQNKQCVFDGTAEQAKKAEKDIFWLANKQ